MNTAQKAWKCTVCGYIHYGEEAPDICPVCGATRELFEEVINAAPSVSQEKKSGFWRCLNCEYIHEGDAPPESCPVCGSPADSFEVHAPEKSKIVISDSELQTIIIIGGGIAGISAAEAARKENKAAKIIIISKEKHFAYYRLNLTRYLAGEIDSSQLYLHDQKWYEDNDIDYRTDRELCSIDKTGKVISLRNGEKLSYDKLIMTMGSHPFIPPIAGANRDNVTALRTKDDADFIINQLQPSIPAVVIGGGLLGLEAAGALSARGIDVTVIEGFRWLLPRQLNETAGKLLEKFVEKSGIKLISSGSVKEIAGDDRVRSVVLEDGRIIDAGLVIISTGVRSNSYIARLSGLEVNKGIVVNNYLQSSDKHIYAAGDISEHHGMSYGTWGPSMFQGTIAGMNAAGGRSEFAGIARSNLLKVLGYDLFSIGQIRGEDASFKSIEFTEHETYFSFFFHDNHMVGAILMGDSQLSSSVKNVIDQKIDCSPVLSGKKEMNSFKEWLKQF